MSPIFHQQKIYSSLVNKVFDLNAKPLSIDPLDEVVDFKSTIIESSAKEVLNTSTPITYVRLNDIRVLDRANENYNTLNDIMALDVTDLSHLTNLQDLSFRGYKLENMESLRKI